MIGTCVICGEKKTLVNDVCSECQMKLFEQDNLQPVGDNTQRERRIASMLKSKHFGSLPYPRLCTAETAAAYADNSAAVFFFIAWWTDLPAGFTRFIWDNPASLSVLLENAPQTAINIPRQLQQGELVLVRGVDIPASEGVWVLPEGAP